MGILNSEEDRLRKRLASVEDELAQFRNGYKGACYACEYVGEKNVELEDEITRLKADIERHIQIAAQIEAQRNALLEALEAALMYGLIPASSAKEGGASAHAVAAQIADKARDAIAKVREGKQ